MKNGHQSFVVKPKTASTVGPLPIVKVETFSPRVEPNQKHLSIPEEHQENPKKRVATAGAYRSSTRDYKDKFISVN